LLTRTEVRALRDGVLKDIDPSEIVKDDVIHILPRRPNRGGLAA
jgi:hypothetical protein